MEELQADVEELRANACNYSEKTADEVFGW
jgi:hypothetical protein